ncbi:hypothetical protein BH23VER1_BH23VER1_24110 [soil metagenome]
MAIVGAAVLVLVAGAFWSRQNDAPAPPEPETSTPRASAEQEIDRFEATFRDAPSEYERIAAATAYDRIGDSATLVALHGRFASGATNAESIARSVLVSRLAELDLAAAIGIARRATGFRARVSAIDIGRALGIQGTADHLLLAIVPTTRVPIDGTINLLNKLASGETDAVLDALPANDPESILRFRAQSLIDRLVTDSDAALAEFRAIGDAETRDAIAPRFLPELAKHAPATAFAIARENSRKLASYHWGKILDAWFAVDPAAARAAFSVPDAPPGLSFGIAAALALAKENPDTASEWIISHIAEPSLRREITSEIVQHLAGTAPGSAVKILADGRTFQPRDADGLASTLARQWARRAAPAALRWALTQSDDLRSGALRGYFGAVTNTDPASAFALLESDSLTTDERAALLEVSEPLAAEDLTRYLALLATMPGDDPLEIVSSAAISLAKGGRSDAARLIVEGLPDPDRRVGLLIQRTTTVLAQADPAGAARWVATLTDPDSRAYGTQNVVDAWARVDPAAAASYVNTLPTGTLVRDRAAFALAERTLAHDPDGALTWIESVGGDDLRREFIGSNLPALLVLRPAWLETNGRDFSREIAEERAFVSYLRDVQP